MPSADARLKARRAGTIERQPVRRQPERSSAGQQFSASPSLLATLPSREQLTAPMLPRLQRLAGNRAVGQLLERTRPITAQRVTLGWQGAEADSWNKGETTVTAEGHKAAPGEAGILRIPVTGIAAGRTG